MIRIIPGYNNTQMGAQVNLSSLRFMLQDEIAELEEESYFLTQQAIAETDPAKADHYEAMARMTQVQITVAMAKLLAMD